MTTELLGIRFTEHGKRELLSALVKRIGLSKKTIVLSGNIQGFNLAYERPWLHDLYNRADFIRIDGAGLRLGALLLGQKLPPRFTMADFIWDLVDISEPHGFRFFLLGASPGIAQIAANRLRERHPALQIAGTQHGFFSKATNDVENEAVIRKITTSQPDILLVGMGMPLQERWIHDNWERLNATVTMTTGAVFDYISGNLRRPPQIFTRTGFEWLGRLIIEPKRLWRRYLIGNPLFLWRILKQRLGSTRSPTWDRSQF